jgi:hypothetical protein
MTPHSCCRPGIIDAVIRVLAARTSRAGAVPVAVSGRLPHLHRYTWAGDDPFSASSLYRCRCGVVRPGL